MREAGQDGFALELHKPAFPFLSMCVWSGHAHFPGKSQFPGILVLPLGVDQRVIVLFRDGVCGQKFDCGQRWKAPEGLGLPYSFRGKTLGSHLGREGAGVRSGGGVLVPEAIREGKYFLCASVSLLET